MKKNLIYAMMVVAAMTSCSKDSDVPTQGNNTPIDDTTPAEIRLSAGVNANIVTRGSGIVGDTIGNGNIWNGQTLMVYAYRDTIKDFSRKEFIIDNKQATMRGTGWTDPSGSVNATTNLLRWVDLSVLYYPLEGSYKFYGYHIDDAKDAAKSQTAIYKKDTVRLEKIIIDGTQDLMIAETQLTKQDTINLYSKGVKNPETVTDNKLTPEQIAQIAAEGLYDKVYSAWSGRREVQPNLQFKHLLSSFKFYVKPGKTTMNKVFIDSISIKGKDQTDMIVLCNNANGRGLANITSSLGENGKGELILADFYLHKDSVYDDGTTKLEIPAFGTTIDITAKDRPATTYLAVAANEGTDPSTLDYTNFGSGMMMFPGEASYEITIYTSEYVKVKEDDPTTPTVDESEYHWLYSPITRTITAPKGGNFLAGTMYFVNLTVYDRQRIDVSATLTPWENGGNIDENLE